MKRKVKSGSLQEGFTLIEMIVVIAIIAILAAVALPRFADLSDDAHRSSVDGVYGAFAVGVNLVHAQWIAKGKPSDVDDLPDFGEGNVNLGQEGWPVGTSGSDNSTSMTPLKCMEIWDGLLVDQAPSVGTSLTADYGAAVGGLIHECLYTYQGGGAVSRTITLNAITGSVVKNNL